MRFGTLAQFWLASVYVTYSLLISFLLPLSYISHFSDAPLLWAVFAQCWGAWWLMCEWASSELRVDRHKIKCLENIITNRISCLPRKTSPQKQKRKKTILLLNKHQTSMWWVPQQPTNETAKTKRNLTLLYSQANTSYIHVLKINHQANGISCLSPGEAQTLLLTASWYHSPRKTQHGC